ncbi:hypothetical protein CARUB_v10027569mg [Capsella rubella]|uniref:DUF295 domain-containing protein n=1 Tax=Capsella rubella TaxID=81985 RepID=R0ETL6_9BRAS|nr:hypothetical protein CARUB_v10027569mg [Capsella rubella]
MWQRHNNINKMVRWYYGDGFESDTVVHKTKRFLVFREKESVRKDQYRDMYYTEDLEIFGHNFGVYDNTTQTCTLFYTEEGPLRSTSFPYWPHPFSLTPT